MTTPSSASPPVTKPPPPVKRSAKSGSSPPPAPEKSSPKSASPTKKSSSGSANSRRKKKEEEASQSSKRVGAQHHMQYQTWDENQFLEHLFDIPLELQLNTPYYVVHGPTRRVLCVATTTTAAAASASKSEEPQQQEEAGDNVCLRPMNEARESDRWIFSASGIIRSCSGGGNSSSGSGGDGNGSGSGGDKNNSGDGNGSGDGSDSNNGNNNNGTAQLVLTVDAGHVVARPMVPEPVSPEDLRNRDLLAARSCQLFSVLYCKPKKPTRLKYIVCSSNTALALDASAKDVTRAAVRVNQSRRGVEQKWIITGSLSAGRPEVTGGDTATATAGGDGDGKEEVVVVVPVPVPVVVPVGQSQTSPPPSSQVVQSRGEMDNVEIDAIIQQMSPTLIPPQESLSHESVIGATEPIVEQVVPVAIPKEAPQ